MCGKEYGAKKLRGNMVRTNLWSWKERMSEETEREGRNYEWQRIGRRGKREREGRQSREKKRLYEKVRVERE